MSEVKFSNDVKIVGDSLKIAPDFSNVLADISYGNSVTTRTMAADGWVIGSSSYGGLYCDVSLGGVPAMGTGEFTFFARKGSVIGGSSGQSGVSRGIRVVGVK